MMTKIVNGVRKECTQEEEARILAERAAFEAEMQKEDQEAAERKQRKTNILSRMGINEQDLEDLLYA